MGKSGFGGPIVQQNSRMAFIYFRFLLLVHTINSCNYSGESYLKKLTFFHNFLTTFLQASLEFTVMSLKFCSTHKLFNILFNILSCSGIIFQVHFLCIFGSQVSDLLALIYPLADLVGFSKPS